MFPFSCSSRPLRSYVRPTSEGAAEAAEEPVRLPVRLSPLPPLWWEQKSSLMCAHDHGQLRGDNGAWGQAQNCEQGTAPSALGARPCPQHLTCPLAPTPVSGGATACQAQRPSLRCGGSLAGVTISSASEPQRLRGRPCGTQLQRPQGRTGRGTRVTTAVTGGKREAKRSLRSAL